MRRRRLRLDSLSSGSTPSDLRLSAESQAQAASEVDEEWFRRRIGIPPGAIYTPRDYWMSSPGQRSAYGREYLPEALAAGRTARMRQCWYNSPHDTPRNHL